MILLQIQNDKINIQRTFWIIKFGLASFSDEIKLWSIRILNLILSKFDIKIFQLFYLSEFSSTKISTNEEKLINLYRGALIPCLESSSKNIKYNAVELVLEYYRWQSQILMVEIIDFLKYFFLDEFVEIKIQTITFLKEIICTWTFIRSNLNQESLAEFFKILFQCFRDAHRCIRIITYNIVMHLN